MAREHAVSVKRKRQKQRRKKSLNTKSCIIHYDQNKSDTVIRSLTEISFEKIKKSASLRQECQNEFVRLDAICDSIPDEFDVSLHGVHRWCYQNFTNVSSFCKQRKRPADLNDQNSDAQLPSVAKRRKKSESVLFPKDSCIFCGKNRRWIRGKHECLVQCVTTTAEESIKEAANLKNDEGILRQVRDVDLVAKELRYHNTCRRDYTRKLSNPHSTREPSATATQIDAHQEAFNFVCQYIEDTIIRGGNVERVTMLREKYLSYLQENYPDEYNPNYKTDKLKRKLAKHFGNRLQYWQPNYKSDLVYATDIPKGLAIEELFEMASSDERIVEECGLLLRRNILDMQKKQENMPWPPKASYLLSKSAYIPGLLQGLLSFTISGKPFEKASNRKARFVNSFSQDICSAATNGQWLMPKHLLLALTLRHLTGSAQLLTLFNRFGHCQSYSRTLELETAICDSVTQCGIALPPTIKQEGSIVTHLCWDNFDLAEETPSGSGTTHSTHGIIIQECDTYADPTDIPCAVIPKTKARSVSYQPEQLEPCFVKQRSEPSLHVQDLKALDIATSTSVMSSNLIWMLCRERMSKEEQIVPEWNGWLSLTTQKAHQRQSTVEFLPPINFPITNNATVQKILTTSQQLSKKVGQQQTIVTFDLAAAKKAYAIIWQTPHLYADVFIQLGAFHTLASYLGALGKRLKGSGFSEIIIEAGVCASGSIDKVLTGQHYNRAMRVHKLMLEALERLLFQAFQQENNFVFSDNIISALEQVAECPDSEGIEKLISNEECSALISEYEQYKEQVRNGHLGKTAQFWLNYTDKVWLILCFLQATKENDLDLHIYSLRHMCPLYFAYDHHNYARYATLHLLSLLQMDKTHPGLQKLLRNNGFSVSRSDVPGCRNAVDITIEQTINKSAKSQGGIIGFSRNIPAYHRWCVSRHERASYVSATHEMADMTSSENDSHRSNQKAKIAASERDVRKILDAFSSFTDPFKVVNKELLYCLSSGTAASKEITDDLLKADTTGEASFSAFVSKVFVQKETSFHSPLKKTNLMTFTNMRKKMKLTASTKKVLELTAERNIFGQLVTMSESNNIDLEKVLSYPLSPVSWSLATADGAPAKTDKAKLLHYLENGMETKENPDSEGVTYIIDGNALLHSLTELPTSFDQVAEKVFNALPKVERVDFVTDSYHNDSIKAVERQRRGVSEPLLLKGSKTRVPRDWKSFLSNDKNKINLMKLLCEEWSKPKYASKLLGRQIYFVCESKCMSLTSYDGVDVATSAVDELCSGHEEADNKIILHAVHASADSTTKVIMVRSPDTDVFVLLLHHADLITKSLLFDTGTGNKRRLLDIKTISAHRNPDFLKSLLGFHAFTGSDSTSAFVRQGKLKPLKVLEKCPEFLVTFGALGNATYVSDELLSGLERFVCAMYGKKASSDINKVRYEIFKQKFHPKSQSKLSSQDGVDLSLLPPCQPSLKMHICRANYQTLIWKSASVQNPDIPHPEGHGWKIDEGGSLTYAWTDGDILPPELSDILSQNPMESEDAADNDDIIEVEFDNMDDIIYEEDYDD